MTTTTNISDLNIGTGSHRLLVTAGGIGNITTTQGQLYASSATALNYISIANGSLTRSNGTDPTLTSAGFPRFSASGATSITGAIPFGYITTASTLATISLPTSFAAGNQIGVIGAGAGGWKLVAGTGTTIKYGTSTTSSGGSLASTNQYDNCILLAIVANTTWAVVNCLSSGLTVS